MMEDRRYWCIEVKGKFIGRCVATRAEIKRACGPWCKITGNNVNVFAAPPPLKAKGVDHGEG